ncbi:MAG: hypothetical protein AVDCRST_MAG07-3298, partial [uncultured Frankineae bacterium]
AAITDQRRAALGCGRAQGRHVRRCAARRPGLRPRLGPGRTSWAHRRRRRGRTGRRLRGPLAVQRPAAPL